MNFKIWIQYPFKHVMIWISPLVTSTSKSSNIFLNFVILTSDVDGSTNFLNQCPIDNFPQNFESKSKYFSLLTIFHSPQSFILTPSNLIQTLDDIIPRTIVRHLLENFLLKFIHLHSKVKFSCGFNASSSVNQHKKNVSSQNNDIYYFALDYANILTNL